MKREEWLSMIVEAITKARALAMLELDSLTNGGRIRLADCIGPLVARCDFQKYPTKTDEIDLEEKGVRFESGRFDELVIDALVIYSGAIYIDTLASTSDSVRILTAILKWAREELSLSYEDHLIRRWGYISDLVFRSDVPLLRVHSSPLQDLARKTSAFTEEMFGGLKYEPSQIGIGHDPLSRKYGVASLVIQHRVNTSYSENIFFSEAPLPTDLHVKYLQEFEEDVKRYLSRN
jgi:hypothetical protein